MMMMVTRLCCAWTIFCRIRSQKEIKFFFAFNLKKTKWRSNEIFWFGGKKFDRKPSNSAENRSFINTCSCEVPGLGCCQLPTYRLVRKFHGKCGFFIVSRKLVDLWKNLKVILMDFLKSMTRNSLVVRKQNTESRTRFTSLMLWLVQELSFFQFQSICLPFINTPSNLCTSRSVFFLSFCAINPELFE